MAPSGFYAEQSRQQTMQNYCRTVSVCRRRVDPDRKRRRLLLYRRSHCLEHRPGSCQPRQGNRCPGHLRLGWWSWLELRPTLPARSASARRPPTRPTCSLSLAARLTLLTWSHPSSICSLTTPGRHAIQPVCLPSPMARRSTMTAPAQDHYEEGRFVLAWGDQGHRDGWCLYKMGCRGPVTRSNCSKVKWNDGSCWPVEAGHGCVGCASSGFWDQHSPFYVPLPGNPD